MSKVFDAAAVFMESIVELVLLALDLGGIPIVLVLN